jgi:hypothetical protein
MVSDFTRLSLQSHITKSKAYFICVADDKMMGHKLQSEILPEFPSKQYNLDHHVISKLLRSTKTKIKDRFFIKAKEPEIGTEANLIF